MSYPLIREGPVDWAPVSVVGALLILGVLGLGGDLYGIHEPTNNDYARMWSGFGVVDWRTNSNSE